MRGHLNGDAGGRVLLFVSKPYSFEILQPLADAARARGTDAAWYTHGLDASRHLGAGERVLDTVDAVREFDPLAVVAPGNWVPDFFPGVKVQVFHGFGIEKRGHFRIRGFFDLYCTHGPLTTEPFEELARRHGHFCVRETGWPKMDPLFRGGREAAALRAGVSKPIVLYAPTFSPSLGSGHALFDEIARIAASGAYHWLVKFHPKADPALVERYATLEGEEFRVQREPGVLPVLQAADVMVSDTSSVVAEFLQLDKPVVTLRNEAPGEHVLDIREPAALEAALARAVSRPDDLIEGGRRFARRMHAFDDGRSSERVLDAVDEFVRAGTAGELRPKPLNLKRRLDVRRRMGYWRWR